VGGASFIVEKELARDCVPPIGPGPPHRLSRRPQEWEEPLLSRRGVEGAAGGEATKKTGWEVAE
jgi:hypothetical protein